MCTRQDVRKINSFTYKLVVALKTSNKSLLALNVAREMLPMPAKHMLISSCFGLATIWKKRQMYIDASVVTNYRTSAAARPSARSLFSLSNKRSERFLSFGAKLAADAQRL